MIGTHLLTVFHQPILDESTELNEDDDFVLILFREIDENAEQVLSLFYSTFCYTWPD